MSRGYATFKTRDRDEYVSGVEYKNHDGADAWAKRAIEHLGIQRSDVLGKVQFPVNSQPSGATVLNL